VAAVNEKLEELKQSLLETDVSLDIESKDKLHDREVRIDNVWVVKIGRGLDFYQKPERWFSLGANIVEACSRRAFARTFILTRKWSSFATIASSHRVRRPVTRRPCRLDLHPPDASLARPSLYSLASAA
jgi:hypothetical protein